MIRQYFKVRRHRAWHPRGLFVAATSDRLNLPGPVRLILGWSLCSSKDRFSKYDANVWAMHRFQHDPIVVHIDNAVECEAAMAEMPRSFHQIYLNTLQRVRKHIAAKAA